jgi:hypothetical protein
MNPASLDRQRLPHMESSIRREFPARQLAARASPFRDRVRKKAQQSAA